MIVAKNCKVPEELEECGFDLGEPMAADVETSSYEGDLDATCWIWTKRADPHTDDPSFYDSFFITLSCVDYYQVGNSYDVKKRDSFNFEKGSLAIVDPMVTHWLHPKFNFYGMKEWKNLPKYWTGLQWEVPRKKLAVETRRIVKMLGGTYIDDIVKRLRHIPKLPEKDVIH